MKIILIANKFGDVRHYADSTLQRNGQAWFIPETDSDWTALICPAVKISRLGTHISEKFASRYYETVSAAALFFPDGARIAPADAPEYLYLRDSALCIGDPVAIGEPNTLHTITVGDQTLQFDAASLEINRMISKVSRYATLKMGDLLIFPADHLTVPLTENTPLIATLDRTPSLTLKIK